MLKSCCTRRHMITTTLSICRRYAASSGSVDSPSYTPSMASKLSQKTAQALYSMERYHQQCSDPGERLQVEKQAWAELQKLPDAAVDDAAASDVADMLGVFCYFARFWSNGVDGPGVESTEDVPSKPVFVPHVERNATRLTPTVDQAPPPRANPLDEVLDF